MVESRQTTALTVSCLFPILASLFVAARTVSRYLGQNFGWDDWLIHLSLVLLLGQTITIYKYIVLSHTGYHAKEIPKQTIEQQVLAMKWSFAVQLFYHPMMCAIRGSIIAFLFRVKDHRRHIRIALHVANWMNIAYTISTSVVSLFQCSPIKYAYLRPLMDQEMDANGHIIKHGKCINSLAFIMGSCGLSIVMDFIIIPIPTVMVWNLQMNRKRKIAIATVMSMGWIATAASVARLIVYYNRNTTADRTWNIGLVSSLTEPSVGIIAACLPTLRRLFTYFMPRHFSEEAPSYPSHRTIQDNHRKHNTFNFRYSMSNMENEVEASRDDAGKERDKYHMSPMESRDSLEQLRDTDVDEGARSSAQFRPVHRVNTAISNHPGEVVEAVPQHALNK